MRKHPTAEERQSRKDRQNFRQKRQRLFLNRRRRLKDRNDEPDEESGAEYGSCEDKNFKYAAAD